MTRDLLDSFVRGARDAQADVLVSASPDDVQRHVSGVLRAERARLVLVSPDAAAPPWSCGADLAAADIELQLTIGIRGPRKLFIVVLDDRRT